MERAIDPGNFPMNQRQPAEWAPHDSVWIGFPSHAELWQDDLAPARAEVAAFARAVRAEGAGERVVLVAANEESATMARDAGVDVILEPFGDIWLRDTGPIVVGGTLIDGKRFTRAISFRFNGWGGKYDLPNDRDLAPRLARWRKLPHTGVNWVLEGGAIDVDGTGLVVTTEQCLLNPNRNAAFGRSDIEGRLHADLGLTSVLWLGEGLLNDHTDGHVDNLARFVGQNRLAIPIAAGSDDPNAEVYADATARAVAFGVEVIPLPSPGRVERDGEIVPASYMNFYIGNAAVVVPTYGAANDDAAVAAIAELFPGRRTIGLRADHILTGGGSFHCISQQVPAGPMSAS